MSRAANIAGRPCHGGTATCPSVCGPGMVCQTLGIGHSHIAGRASRTAFRHFLPDHAVENKQCSPGNRRRLRTPKGYSLSFHRTARPPRPKLTSIRLMAECMFSAGPGSVWALFAQNGINQRKLLRNATAIAARAPFKGLMFQAPKQSGPLTYGGETEDSKLAQRRSQP